MSYTVYTAEYIGLSTLNHIAIYIETDSERGRGLKFHVTGNILTGMTYEKRRDIRPENDALTYIPGSQVRIGSVEATDLARFEAACESVPVPGAQFRLNGALRDPEKPVRRCGERVREVREKVLVEGILGE